MDESNHVIVISQSRLLMETASLLQSYYQGFSAIGKRYQELNI